MARFQSLSHVGLVLKDAIEGVVPAGTEVRLSTPPEQPEAPAGAVRITLLWTTPQPAHRNDPEAVGPDGMRVRPLPTISAWYVVTTYGATEAGDSTVAHDLLGRILRAFLFDPEVLLPQDGMGEGRIHVVPVPTDADLTEKVYTPLQVRQRPWALLDVGPVQLARPPGPSEAVEVVRPGGVNLVPFDVVRPPRIERITPSRARLGGRIRVDVVSERAPTAITVGGTPITGAALTEMAPGGPLLATLPGAVPEGAHDVTVRAGTGIPSVPVTLTVLPAAAPSVDAPTELRHSRVVDLLLEGSGLGVGPVEVYFWPDRRIEAPSEVVRAPAVAADTQIVVLAAELARLREALYRVSVRIPPHTYTPYVLLEATP